MDVQDGEEREGVESRGQSGRHGRRGCGGHRSVVVVVVVVLVVVGCGGRRGDGGGGHTSLWAAGRARWQFSGRSW